MQILHTSICFLEYEGGIFTYTRNQQTLILAIIYHRLSLAYLLYLELSF